MHRYFAHLIGVVTVVTMFMALIFTVACFMPGIVLRCLPHYGLQRLGARYVVWNARRWVGINQRIYQVLHGLPNHRDYGTVTWHGQPLDPSKSYLLVANHQSWADILILFHVFHRRVPFLRFFLKQGLIWVPLVGMACWGMDFPFMKRHSPKAIARNPKLAAEDVETTRRACEIYKTVPVAVVTFPEGTRFSPLKKASKGSPYQYLLRPKAAGLSFTLNAMGDQFAGMIDVTLHYQATGKNLLWGWLCGQQTGVQIAVDVRPLPSDVLHGDYANDLEFREHFQHWLNGVWQDKDQRLQNYRAGAQ